MPEIFRRSHRQKREEGGAVSWLAGDHCQGQRNPTLEGSWWVRLSSLWQPCVHSSPVSDQQGTCRS